MNTINELNLEPNEYQELVKKVNAQSCGVERRYQKNSRSNIKTKIYCCIQEVELYKSMLSDNKEVFEILDSAKVDLMKALNKLK